MQSRARTVLELHRRALSECAARSMDLFVEPAARGQGVGLALMSALARITVELGFGRFEWAVLDWNTPSLEFYRALGAVPQSDWTVQRITGAPLERLAQRWSGALAPP